jgi:hypothetical protein
MATTNYELEVEFFGDSPKDHKLVQDLLTNAANAYKNMNKMFGNKKYELYLKATSHDLNELSKIAGSLEDTEKYINIVKNIHPNWDDAYAIIDALIENSKQSY